MMHSRKLLDVEKAAERILSDGLYSLLLEEIKSDLKASSPDAAALKSQLETNPAHLDEYVRINRSNHVSCIDLDETLLDSKELKEKVGKLKELEQFAEPASHSVFAMWIGSLVVLLIFALHNVLAMYTDAYSTHALWVYLSYALLSGLGLALHLFLVRGHNQKHSEFQSLSDEVVRSLPAETFLGK